MTERVLTADDKAHLRQVRLELPQMKMIDYLAKRGGEIPWDWSKVSSEAKAMLADLINKQLVIDREYVTDARQARGVLRLGLTAQGRAIAEQIEKMTLADSATDLVGDNKVSAGE
jgi:hypothetical protein